MASTTVQLLSEIIKKKDKPFSWEPEKVINHDEKSKLLTNLLDEFHKVFPMIKDIDSLLKNLKFVQNNLENSDEIQ